MKVIVYGFYAWLLMPFSWGKWIDITTFHWAGGYLLQGRRNNISHAVQFRITEMKQRFKIADAPFVELNTIQEKGI
jgi:hypothetical protein